MTKDDKVLLTARYVEGDMDSFERHEYELRLENEADLNEHLRDYQDIHQNLRLHLALGTTQQSFFPQEKQRRNSYRIEEPDVLPLKSMLTWFVSIAMGIIAIFLVWAPWNVNLYRSYAFFHRISVPQKFVGDSAEMRKAVYLYNDGSYLLANHLLATQYAKNPSSAELAYAYANTLIETEHLDEARLLLKTVASGDSNFKYFAEFSMALSYVREQNAAMAKAWLQKIPKTSENHAVAEELMGKL